LYQRYVNGHAQSRRRIAELEEQNAEFRGLLEKAKRDPRCQKNNIGDLLIMPVQRLPRYQLLLEGLMKYTPVDHSDFKSLAEAMQQIRHLVAQVNDSEKDQDSQLKLFELIKSVAHCPVSFGKSLSAESRHLF
jgi:hypothetical protein